MSKRKGRLPCAGDYLPYILIAAVSGAIPAMTIKLRGGLIDLASGVEAGESGFFGLLALLIGMSFFGTVCRAGKERLSERHRIRALAKIDAERLEKAARTAFPVTETERFHALWRSSADAPELDDRIFRAAGDLTEIFVRLGLSLYVLWTMDPRIAGGIVLLLTAGILLNRELARNTEGFWPKYRENMRRTNYLSSLLMQREYAGERKLFSFDEEIDRRYAEAFSKAKMENAKLGRGRFRIEALMKLMFAAYSVMVVLMLMRPLLDGRITLGLFTSAFYAASGLERSCGQACAALYDIMGSRRRIGGYFEFMELEEDEANGAAGDEPLRSIELRDVTFTYPGAGGPVLEHLSFRLEPGHHYALVGENGCGKSTLVKLIAGLYKPDSGQVLVNGREVSSLSPEERQRMICVVFQDYYRYPLTIRENVSLGMDRAARDEEIEKIFESLDLHPVAVEGEAGYDAVPLPLYKSGVGLSGGEWQKLAVARCILSKAQIGILDEPNASLDPMAEAAVYAACREMLREKTTIFISHRLGSVRMADEILVLRGGRLAARGDHEELMAKDGYYSELFNTQKGMYI